MDLFLINGSVIAQSNDTESLPEEESIPSLPEDQTNENSEQRLLGNDSSPSKNEVDDELNTNNKANLTADTSSSNPDGDCLFDPELPKCAAVNGKCPDGYHKVDYDETGRCIPNSDGCPTEVIFRPDMKTCDDKEERCMSVSRVKRM
ncbi:hypothetical protein BH23THE1_BH23THE1_23810 [soil metagenome]